MSLATPQIRLSCNDQTFAVDAAILLEQCTLFKKNPKLLASREYRTVTRAGRAAFVEFVKCLRGEGYLIVASTISDLERLAREFGFSALVAACASSRASDDVLGRLAFLEAQLVALSAQVEGQQQDIFRLRCERQAADDCVSLIRAELDGLKRGDESVAQLRRRLDAEQQYRRGCEYFYGTNGFGERGMDLSRLLGLAELRRAADGGHSDAQYVCGRILRECAAFEDTGASTRYMKLAADSGNSYGEMGYARALDFGYGVARDDDEAFVYYERAAAHGNARGQNGCGYCLEFGKGVQRSPERAAEYYRSGAEQGNAAAMNNFGLCLRDGKGVERDAVKAAECCRLAAELGLPAAVNAYAWCMENGAGVKKDVVRAAELYRAAADQGNALAQANFGRCLETGVGVTRDKGGAAEYYRMAANQGEQQARAAFERLTGGKGRRGWRRTCSAHIKHHGGLFRITSPKRGSKDRKCCFREDLVEKLRKWRLSGSNRTILCFPDQYSVSSNFRDWRGPDFVLSVEFGNINEGRPLRKIPP
jgi:TPR repeat protein